MVDAGKYFTINRARQYGKTTTLQALKIGSRWNFFSDESKFCLGFDELFEKSLHFSSASPEDAGK